MDRLKKPMLPQNAGLAAILLLLCFLSILCLPLTATADSLTEAVENADIRLSFRLRYEDVNTAVLINAEAVTLRSTLAFKSAPINDTSLLIEFQDTSVLSPYNFSDGVNGKPTATIADPASTRVNRLLLQYRGLPGANIKLGRQRITFDNQRFIGNVDFRQNEQTFDALSIACKIIPDLNVTYAWVNKVNTIFGSDAQNNRLDTNSHLFNAAWLDNGIGDLSFYHYRINHDVPSALNSNTTGIRLVGDIKPDQFKYSWVAEFATQSDGNRNPVSYRANYHLVEGRLGYQRFGVRVGQEQLGTNNGTGFSTPLATLHKFQGFTDQFLQTPTNGITDNYLTLEALPGRASLAFNYHQFKPVQGSGRHGDEWGLLFSVPFAEYFHVLFKYAEFSSSDFGAPDTRKYWLQFNFDY